MVLGLKNLSTINSTYASSDQNCATQLDQLSMTQAIYQNHKASHFPLMTGAQHPPYGHIYGGQFLWNKSLWNENSTNEQFFKHTNKSHESPVWMYIM